MKDFKEFVEKTNETINKCFSTTVFATLAIFACIIAYVNNVTGVYIPIIAGIASIIAIVAGIIYSRLHYVLYRKHKVYRTPMERLNSAYIRLCCVTILIIEALIGAYCIWGYENFWIINPVTLLGIFTIACIPLGAICQLVVRIDHQLRIKKHLAQRG